MRIEVGVGLLLAATILPQQGPPRDQTPTSPASAGIIRGRVVRADTGEPLRRVEVRVDEWSTGNHAGGPAATLTDAEGRYQLTLPPGRFQLKARRGGYVEIAHGQRRPFERGRPIELAEKAVLENIDFALPPGAVVTGRVVDETGDVVAHASVSLLRRRFVEGARRLIAEHSGATDDRGEFRIFGVPPGEYAIVAKFEREMGVQDRLRYVPTYYPGTPVVSAAQRVTVGLGQELPGITIALARAATATVRGVVRWSGVGSSGPFASVSAREINGPEAYGGIAMTLVGADGTFTLPGLLPGTYLLEARWPAAAEFASAEVVVDGADLSGVTMIVSKGASARGRIRFDTGTAPNGLRPSDVFVFFSTVAEHSMDGHRREPPVTNDDWTFELEGLRGRGFIRAGTWNDWHMKRVRRDGVDVTDTPLDLAADVDGLEIELTQRHTTVSGGVSDGRGAAVVDATVVVFAEDAERWGPHSRFIQSARPDQRGQFTVRGLPPGRYLAAAVAYLEPGDEYDPDLLEGWREDATAFSLSDGETRALELTLRRP